MSSAAIVIGALRVNGVLRIKTLCLIFYKVDFARQCRIRVDYADHPSKMNAVE